MTPVLADSFYYIALLNRNDAAHKHAVELAHDLCVRVTTTAFVMIEIADAMGNSGQRGSFLALLENLEADHNVTILPPTKELYEAGLSLYAKGPDKNWSLTDCVSFVVMDRFGLKDALTADRHFQQAGFKALLA